MKIERQDLYDKRWRRVAEKHFLEIANNYGRRHSAMQELKDHPEGIRFSAWMVFRIRSRKRSKLQKANRFAANAAARIEEEARKA